MPSYQGAGRLHKHAQAKYITMVVFRISASVFGGYGFTWGFTALASALLMWLMPKSEAVITATMLGFIIYLIAALWAFSARKLILIWLVLAGGGALMTQIAFLLVRA